jgi:O-acetyl-ADP-ribose deacetylase (regulator of RNase III)
MAYAFCAVFCGYRIRGGGADGSDQSYQVGAKLAYDYLSEIFQERVRYGQYSAVIETYIPWIGYNNHTIRKGNGVINVRDKSIVSKSEQIAKKEHPAWSCLSVAEKRLMVRNTFQVLGCDLQSPARFLHCFTGDGASRREEVKQSTGGTGQALRIAFSNNIGVANVGGREGMERTLAFIERVSSSIVSMYGIDVYKAIDDNLSYGLVSSSQVNDVDIVDFVEAGGAEVLVHGYNCFNTRGSGLAKEIMNKFPEVYSAVSKTKKGDRSKLGNYLAVDVDRKGRRFTIVNAYTQYRYGRDGDCYVDYYKTRMALSKVARDFPGRTIAINRLGCGLAGGCWSSMSRIIESSLRTPENKVIIVNGKNPNVDLDRGVTDSQMPLFS